MSNLRIVLFGKFQANCGNQPLVGLEGRKVQELFCYLLLYPDRAHPRETLADLLWSDHSTVQSKMYLRKALWQLQAALDLPNEPVDDSVLLVDSDWIQLNPEASLWLDVAEFEQISTLVHGIPGEELNSQHIQLLQYAVSLYKGELLGGWYQDWCLYERERLQHLYLTMLDKLMKYYETHDNYETGLRYGIQILRYDRARECTHRRLMRLQYLAGDRTAALRQYERCITVLDEELGVRPSRRTVQLYEEIRIDQIEHPSETLSQKKVHSPPPIAQVPQVLAHLKQFQATMLNFQRQVDQHIEIVESLIKPPASR